MRNTKLRGFGKRCLFNSGSNGKLTVILTLQITKNGSVGSSAGQGIDWP